MTGNKIDSIDPTDEVLPPRSLVLFGLQHVLVMAASPITAVFLVSKALGFSDALTVSLISATFLICGLGTILQSFGPAGFGARLPFIMVPGGAPIAIFLAIAQQTDVQTAVGAVILTAGFYFLALPVFRRLLRYFPPIVVGTMLLLVSVNLVRIYGGTITGKQGSEGFADPMNVGLALATIALTVIFARVFTGTLQRISVMLGLIAGSAIAIGAGYMDPFRHLRRTGDCHAPASSVRNAEVRLFRRPAADRVFDHLDGRSDGADHRHGRDRRASGRRSRDRARNHPR